MTVTVTIPATSANLGPGFDCLGMALGLYNKVIMTATAEPGVIISVAGEGAEYISTAADNLVLQAAEQVFARVGKRPSGLRIRLENEIPIGGGLGSSGAAVVGGLHAANALLGHPLSFAEVRQMAIAIEGHPDNVVSALHGGLVLAIQDGETWHIEPVPLPPLQAIIVLPTYTFPTSAARLALPAQIARADAIFNHSRVALLLRALQTADYARLRVAMQDRLHQPYRVPLVPGLAEAFAAAAAAGAAGVALSGAGPSLVAFAPHDHERVAAAAQAAFMQAGLPSRAWVLPVTTIGAQVSVQRMGSG